MWNEQPAYTPVLVVLLAGPAERRHAAEQHWYRIPVRHAPHHLAASYLAFYQSAAFGAERWCIREIAAVRAVAVVRRIDLLPEEANHPRAHEHYYRLALGPLEQLPAPIPARRLRRVTFIASTIGALRAAADVAQLWRLAAAEPPDLWGAGIGRRSVR